MSEGPIDNLVKMLGSLPGLGNRSARRIALHLLNKKDTAMRPLANMLERAADEIKHCTTCGNLDTIDPCRICASLKRDPQALCVVGQVSDLWAVDRTGTFRGYYHVLGGVLSALDGVGPSDLRIDTLEDRVRDGAFTEVILALSATVDGQSTAHYIADRLKPYNVTVTRLAHGVPVGGELDYLDDGTISTAFKARKSA